MSKTIALFGAGFVTTTVVEYLTRRPENKLVIVNRTLSHAQEKAKLYAHSPEKVEYVEADIEKYEEAQEKKKLEDVIARSDIVISLVPYTYHVILANICIEKKVNMITTSYISPAMKALNDSAIKAGITIMNEIGVDPGTDHMAAVKIIKEVREKGGKIISFTSWCGGLPALEDIEPNPLKYKFSWSPRGVLMAGNNDAKYLENGQVKVIEAAKLLATAKKLDLHKDFDFEGYPNRDSTPYAQEYNIPEAKTVLRGTLRYKGCCKFMDQIKRVGLANAENIGILKPSSNPPKWNEVMKQVLNANDTTESSLGTAALNKLGLSADSDDGKAAIENLKWFGIFSDELTTPKNNLLDTFSDLLAKKLGYKKGERDLIFLQHNFEIEYPDGKKQQKLATLTCYGDKEGKFSAMAKTTGLPCAISTQLILDGIINKKGVFGPMDPAMNQHIEERLDKEGISFVEETIDI